MEVKGEVVLLVVVVLILMAIFSFSIKPDASAAINTKEAMVVTGKPDLAFERTVGDKTMKLFIITKNEWPIIKSWVLFHGDIYGFDNLYVYDGSDDPRVVDFLKKSAKLGTHVMFTRANLNELTDIYNHDMKTVLNETKLLVKMDTDELLFGWDPVFKQVITDPRMMQKYLNSLVLDGRKLLVPYSMYNYVNSSSCTIEDNIMITSTKFLSGWPMEGMVRKVLIPTFSFEFMDLGGHSGRVKAPHNNSDVVHTHFALAHYHFQCFANSILLNNQAVYSHGYVTGKESKKIQIEKLSNLTQGYPKIPCRVPSCHKAFQMLQWLKDPVAFQKSYEENLEYRVKNKSIPELVELRDKLLLLEDRYQHLVH